MPKISLCICLYQERDLVERLLQKTKGYYDDLVVIHDGPDVEGVRSLVEAAGGKWLEEPREYQQEVHWPQAWREAQYDWILRLDADEFPSEVLLDWLDRFRKQEEPDAAVSGYTCWWPYWDGQQAWSLEWAERRPFFFHRYRVKFLGIPEQTPMADRRWIFLPYVLHHQPKRKSYGVRAVLFRRQFYRWCWQIAKSLSQRPMDVPRWRYEEAEWPAFWERYRKHPLRTGFFQGICCAGYQAYGMWRQVGRISLSVLAGTAISQFLIGLTLFYFQLISRWREKSEE